MGVKERRITNGAPLNVVNSPKYAVDYGVRRPIIMFHTPTANSDVIFSNYMESMTFDTVNLDNIVFYNPISAVSGF